MANELGVGERIVTGQLGLDPNFFAGAFRGRSRR